MNSFTFAEDEEDYHQATLLAIIPTLPPNCSEIRISGIAFEGGLNRSSGRYLQQLGLASLDKILCRKRVHKSLRRLVFEAKLMWCRSGDRTMQGVGLKMLLTNFMYDYLPKTSRRGVDFVVAVDDSEAVEMPF